nr:MAG: hypothetical protein [Apis mellifera filamentous virus]
MNEDANAAPPTAPTATTETGGTSSASDNARAVIASQERMRTHTPRVNLGETSRPA